MGGGRDGRVGDGIEEGTFWDEHWVLYGNQFDSKLHILKKKCKHHLEGYIKRGAWVAQPIKRPTWAQVMISWFVSSSPASGSVLTAQSLEPASDSVSPSLSAPPPFMLCLSLSQK